MCLGLAEGSRISPRLDPEIVFHTWKFLNPLLPAYCSWTCLKKQFVSLGQLLYSHHVQKRDTIPLFPGSCLVSIHVLMTIGYKTRKICYLTSTIPEQTSTTEVVVSDLSRATVYILAHIISSKLLVIKVGKVSRYHEGKQDPEDWWSNWQWSTGLLSPIIPGLELLDSSCFLISMQQPCNVTVCWQWVHSATESFQSPLFPFL